MSAPKKAKKPQVKRRDGPTWMAQKIAQAIMRVGDEPGSPCKRIQFKGGEWPDNERNQGGLCEDALFRIVYRTLLANRRTLRKF